MQINSGTSILPGISKKIRLRQVQLLGFFVIFCQIFTTFSDFLPIHIPTSTTIFQEKFFLNNFFSLKCVLFLAHDCRLVVVVIFWISKECLHHHQSFLAIIWRLSISFTCHYLFISPFSVSCLCENAWWILIVVYKMLHKLNQRSKFKNTQEMRARDR